MVFVEWRSVATARVERWRFGDCGGVALCFGGLVVEDECSYVRRKKQVRQMTRKRNNNTPVRAIPTVPMLVSEKPPHFAGFVVSIMTL